MTHEHKTGIEMTVNLFKERFFRGSETPDRCVTIGKQVAMQVGEGYACYEVDDIYDGMVHLHHVSL